MVTDAVEEAARWSNIPSVRGAALVCRGALERDSRPLLQAIDAYRSSGRVLELARAIEDTGLVLVAEGDASAGGRHLEEALGLFEGLAASYDSARVTRHLREFGIRRGRRGARKRPAFGWEALTRSEGQVAELAAMGLTNPQIGERLFVSKRTVATHLSHIFQKLGVRSRVELAAAIANRDTGREIAVPSTSVT
jgi:DNA-binding NarL/FixJ family response regulator